jgi:hypothetical protein
MAASLNATEFPAEEIEGGSDSALESFYLLPRAFKGSFGEDR